MMKQTAYIFDFDGTLVDSMPAWSAKMLNILAKAGITPPDGLIKHIATLGDRGTAVYFREELGVPYSMDEMFAMMDEYALPRYRDEIPLKETVRDLLASLKERGHSLHVLTASPHKMVDPCLTRLGIFDWFNHVWTCEDFGMVKTNPEIYREAVRRIGCGVSDAAFFDDNVGAIRTASAAGLYTVGVFDKTGEDYIGDMKTIADRFVYTFGELMTKH
ncbi:MAG: HAD family phosphatase [Ruminococcaceae bacterium]|nr:HAD family phosphatase [Oscillospiraceae bacterium]